MFSRTLLLLLSSLLWLFSCQSESKPEEKEITAKEILGEPKYQAMSYGSFRSLNRDTIPTVDQLKEDLLIMEALGIKIIRTYHTQLFGDTENLLKAIHQLRQERPNFELYLMLGAWMECADPWTDSANHQKGHDEQNLAEINKAIELAKQYPDIIKVIAIGNEAMVHWAPYHVAPKIIFEGVKKIQHAKRSGELSKDLWVTSSDNHAAWGAAKEYRNPYLDSLLRMVDFISVHTYPFHDTHYNPDFWLLDQGDSTISIAQIEEAMDSAVNYAIGQYLSVAEYVKGLGLDKEVHIGESGWASLDNDLYGKEGSLAADEYKQALYFSKLTSWCKENQISCFYFELFDEPWKSSAKEGSENHFGLIRLNGEIKYALWNEFDSAKLGDLSRNGKSLHRSYGGSFEQLKESILP